MAESANLRQNLQNVPSIFEISAAETLDSLVYPALNKTLNYLQLRLNFKLWNGQYIREEISPLITWVLQYLYLRNRGSSFGESFYGLQRTVTETGELLSRQQQFFSASVLTFLPFLEQKLKLRSTQHEYSICERQLLNIFRAYHALKSMHTFLYLIKYTASHSPIFRALHLTLRYPTEPPKEDKATYLFLKLLEVLAFFLQFIDWWYSNDQRRKVGGTLKNPEAVKFIPVQKEAVSAAKGICPICLMKIENPTACAMSGFVFCWKCIVSYMKERSSCPITGYNITLDDLIRVYET